MIVLVDEYYQGHYMKLYRVKVQLPTGDLRTTIIADWNSELAAQHVIANVGECHLVFSRED